MILSIYEKKKLDRLKEKNVVIEELYLNTNNKNKYYTRLSDGKVSDPIIDNILYEKKYYYDEKLLKQELYFNPDMKFTIINYNNKNEIVECPNCGNKDIIINMIDGCPYCYTNFTYGINNERKTKQLNPSLVGFNLIIKKIIIAYLLFSLIVSVIHCEVKGLYDYFFIYFFVYSSIASIILILSLIMYKFNISKQYKQTQIEVKNSKKDENIVKKNIYMELISYLYDTEKDLIDFDILEFVSLDFEKNKVLSIINLRKIYFTNGHIYSKTNLYNVQMIENKNYKNLKNLEVLECPNCGASIDTNMKECEYCHKINSIKNEWILETIEKNKDNKNKNE